MKAIMQERFGPPDTLRLVDTDPPEVGTDDVLIQVHAAALNPYDWHMLRGDPYVARLMGVGLTKPKVPVAGVDAAGVVDAVGSNVRELRRGDEVLGGVRGAFAEYACAAQDKVVPKPGSLTFEQAASVPMAATTALRGIRDVGEVKAGQRVLVIGAGGGIGTFAVQIAAALGAEVTGVCSTGNVELVRSLGAAHVVDYTNEDFTAGETRYDVILDNVSNLPLGKLRGALTPKGTLVLNGGGSPGHVFGPITGPPQGGRGQPVRLATATSAPVEADPGGVAHRDGAHRERKAHADRRPHLPARRYGRGLALRRAGTRARQGRRHRGVRRGKRSGRDASEACTVLPMSRSLLEDAFGHHVWATLRLIDSCIALDPEQRGTTVPGTYGSILETLRHLVGADSWYLFVMTGERTPQIDEDHMDIAELRAAMEADGAAWSALLAEDPEPDHVMVGRHKDGSETHAPMGIRLAQALHHGTVTGVRSAQRLLSWAWNRHRSTSGTSAGRMDAWSRSKPPGVRHLSVGMTR